MKVLFVPALLYAPTGDQSKFWLQKRGKRCDKGQYLLIIVRWKTGLIESKYRLFHITCQLWRVSIYPAFIFDSSLSIYANTECRWKRKKKSKNNSLQHFWGCSKAVLSHFILANCFRAATGMNTLLWYHELTDKSKHCFLVICPS